MVIAAQFDIVLLAASKVSTLLYLKLHQVEVLDDLRGALAPGSLSQVGCLLLIKLAASVARLFEGVVLSALILAADTTALDRLAEHGS